MSQKWTPTFDEPVKPIFIALLLHFLSSTLMFSPMMPLHVEEALLLNICKRTTLPSFQVYFANIHSFILHVPVLMCSMKTSAYLIICFYFHLFCDVEVDCSVLHTREFFSLGTLVSSHLLVSNCG